MQKRKYRVWLRVGAAVVTLMLTFGGCTGGGAITREEAITTATQAVQDDGVMSLDGRSTQAAEEATYWHIYFPFSSPLTRGGEPHVWVDKASGNVTKIYYTE
jgi:hypothetical protein